MPAGFLDRLQRILPLGQKVADDIVCEETEILEKVIQRMFEVMHKVADFSCNYVKGDMRSCYGLPSIDDYVQRERPVDKPTWRRLKKWTGS